MARTAPETDIAVPIHPVYPICRLPAIKRASPWFLASALLLAGCNPAQPVSGSIEQLMKESGGKSIDLARAVPGEWDRVCILGPYSDNRAARNILGFDWDVKAASNIGSNDGITLLVFVQGKRVLQHAEHQRSRGDFSSAGGQCYPRQVAQFVRKPDQPDNWPFLINKPSE